jgi:hypothetical protein
VADYPTIGQPFLITWDNTNQGPSVTLSLYNGCPNNCKEVTDIVGLTANTGSYAWTPSCTLPADEEAEGYGILLIDDTLCYTQWSFHFGLHPDSTGACNASPSSAAASSAAATSPTSTATMASLVSSAAAASSTTTTLTANTKTSMAGAAVTALGTGNGSGSSPSSAAPSVYTSTTYVAASPTVAASLAEGAAARATQVVGGLVGAAALAAVALAL